MSETPSKLGRSWRGWPIATQLIVLMTVTLLLAQLINIGIVVLMPPRPAPFALLSQIVDRARPLVEDIEHTPSDERAALLTAASRDNMQFTIGTDRSGTVQESGMLERIAAYTARALQLNADAVRVEHDGFRPFGVPGDLVLQGPVMVRPAEPPPPAAAPQPPPSFGPPGPLAPPAPGAPGGIGQMPLPSPIVIALRTPSGAWIEARTAPAPDIGPWVFRIVALFIASALVLVPAALWFARRLALPIKRFAIAAEELGRNPNAPSTLVEDGPSELRTATRAFNDMLGRNQRFIKDRTLMLAAMSHDLRTPIQRLRYRVDAVPDAERARFNSDLDDIEAMIEASLTFARDAAAAGTRQSLDLSALVETVCNDASDAGQSVTFVPAAERLVIKADPLGLKRVIANLVDNAIKYGDAARVRVMKQDDHAVVEIVDGGPGIPAERIEAVFEPFRRLEESRNRSTGGVGLGLSIARTIARAHGGDVTLINRSEGGMCARLALPL